MTRGVVIGAGPAGLAAAEAMAKAGMQVTLAEAMPSVARKFLMAGKSGLNLTKSEPVDQFIAAYGEIDPAMIPILRSFGPEQVIEFAEGLGQEVFVGSTGRVFPKVMKASPLLRAWLRRLADLGVDLRTRWRWTGFDGAALQFDTPEGPVHLTPDAAVLALGGASWARLGSRGDWVAYLPKETVAPFAPANMGFQVNWSAHMEPFFGAPVKGCALVAGDRIERGEFVVSAQGIEGGGIYSVSRAIREGAALHLDLCPDLTLADVRTRLARPRGKASQSNHLRKVLGLQGVKLALLNEFGRPFADDLAPVIKALPLRIDGPRPMDEAISTAGGVRFSALTEGLMLKDRPGVFCAGEMLDWEAPTGGYLITGCLATGRWAGRAAAAHAGASLADASGGA
ncbi:TIGR03862 family flavoprotein [Loktanella sp. IMCC34160]|uniref:TIGR03862 family flavoprotein n=1 Tax=Loktanella sp. IMCC34160 TaxID=2510646 RepID=UPI00101D0CB8|nr:TIGR03862 family flavoprotein [Loktanella sp. IMCC34160]RYG91106.1 TIGR03862 family flavoprotein [Loktanella sp. IMCC34160]